MIRILFLSLCFVFVSVQANALSLFNVKDGLVQFLLKKVNDPGEFEIAVGEAITPEDGGTRLNKISISDSEGVWMTVESAEFNWNKSRLLRGEIEIDYIRMIRPVILRAPSSNNPPAVEEPDGTRSAADNWPRSPITVKIKEMALVEADIREGLLPQRLQFDAVGSVEDEGNLQSFKLDIKRTDDVSGSIDLSYERNFDTRTLDLSLIAKEAAGGLVSALSGLPNDVPVEANIQASGPDSDWSLNLALYAKDMVDVRGRLALGWSGVPLQVDADLSVQPKDKLPADIRAALSPKAQLQFVARENEGGQVVLDTARIDTRYLALVATGAVSRDLDDIDVNVQLSADGRLANFTDGFAFNTMAINGDVKRNNETISFNVDGTLNNPTIDKIQTGTMTFATKGVFNDGHLALEKTALTSRLLSATVAGDIFPEESRIDLSYDVNLPNVSPIAQAYGQAVAGAIRDKGTVKGTFDNLDIRGRIDTQGLASNGIQIGTLSASHTNTISPEAIAGTLDGSLRQSAYGDGTLQAGYALSGSVLNIRSLKADMLSSTINANAKVNLDSSLVDGRLNMDVRDLTPIGEILGMPLAGRGTIDATLETRSGKQGVDATASLKDIAYDTVKVAGIDIDASTPALGAPQSPLLLNAQVSNLTIEDQDIALETVTLRADGLQSDLPVYLSMQGNVQDQPLILDADALVSMGEATQISVGKFDLNYAEQTVGLNETLLVTLAKDSTSVENIALRLPYDGLITGDVQLLETGLMSSLVFDTVDLRTVNIFQPKTIKSGVFKGRVEVDTRPNSARMDADIELAGLEIMQAQAAGAMSVEAKGTWNGVIADLDVKALGSFKNPIAIQATLPVRATDKIMPEIQMTEAFKASAIWSGELEDIWQYAPLPEHLLAGKADLDFRASGTLENPVFSGGVNVVDGLYQNITTGSILTDLTLTTSLSTQQQVQLNLSANDGSGGDVSGKVTLNFGDQSTVDANFKANRAILVRRDDVIARMNIDMQATGALTAPVVKGDIDILEAEVRLVNDLPPSIVDLGDVRTTNDPPLDKSDDADDSAGAELDIAINAPGKIYIRGRGLDSEWATSLKVKGAAASPRISGRFYALRGRLDFLGKPFDLDTGEITFRGEKKINPQLDLQLVRETSDMRGSIILAGRAQSPELRFASSPSLPEDEILPRLVFGRSKQSLSAAEALQLASGIATLTGGGAGPLDTVRAALGFDALRIESEEDGSSSVAVGRYVREGVYIGAKQALDGQGGAVVIELDVTDNITADVEVGQGGSATSAGVNYKFDF